MRREPGDGDFEGTPLVPPRPDEPPPPPPHGGQAAKVPQLADGVEVIGEYEDSGYKEPHYIARRADGQVVQLSQLLYLVADEIDGRRDYAAIANAVSDRFGRAVSAENVQTLVEDKLSALGLVAGSEDAARAKVDPLLALKFRAAVIPAGVTRAVTVLFRPLFWPPVVLAVVAGIVALDVWLFFVHGVAQSVREIIYEPALLLMVLGLVVLSTAFHECGHATACAYGGAKPGVMGVGIYVVWPAFYTDVTDAYRLGRAGRLRTDLGGVYFNAIFALATAGAYFATGFEPLLVVVLIQHFVVLQQMLPLLRMDGYYVLADLTGVPDLFMRIRPTLRSLIAWRKTDENVKELKPWVRVVVTLWVMLLIPFLLYVFGMIVISAPRMFATAYDSFVMHYEKASAAFSSGDTAEGAATGARLAGLVLPLAGITLTFGRVGKRMVTGIVSATAGHPLLRGAAIFTGGALLAGASYVLWPNGDYRPIHPDEKGTILELTRSFEALPQGRPGLTPEHETELGGVQMLSEDDSEIEPLPQPTDTAEPLEPDDPDEAEVEATPTLEDEVVPSPSPSG